MAELQIWVFGGENDERQRTIEKIETRLSVLEQNQYKK